MKKNHKRAVGKLGELLVAEYYKECGWRLITTNRTMRGGEIDCIVENKTTRCFIEVKVVNTIDVIDGYITFYKKKFLKRAIRSYNFSFPTTKYLRIDVVFVKENRIVHSFENVIL